MRLVINWGDFLSPICCKAELNPDVYCFREELTFQSPTVWHCLSGEVRVTMLEDTRTSINTFKDYTHSHLHKHTNAFGQMPYVKVCRCECVFMQLRLIRKWDDCVFIWFYLVILTLSLALKVLSFCCLDGYWYWCQGDMHWTFNSLCPLRPALDSEYDLEKQSCCLSVNEEAYLEERDPLVLKHKQIISEQTFQVFLPWFLADSCYVVNFLLQSLTIHTCCG